MIAQVLKKLFLVVLILVIATLCYADERQDRIDEHVYGGIPDTTDVGLGVWKAYVSRYNEETRTPSWVAYHIIPDYRNTPTRAGRFKSFLGDTTLQNPVYTSQYVGLQKARGFARGHLAPYAISGGDRDNDTKYADTNKTISDLDEEPTVREINLMSNIAPQHHAEFNGQPGLWYNLERWVQDTIVIGRGIEVWVFAGCIFGPGEHEAVGKNYDIIVPPMFYKIVVREPDPEGDVPVVLAFLFPHQRSKHGDIQDFLVSVDVIEAMTGLDFFHDLDDDDEEWLEDTDIWEFWGGF